MRHKQLIRRTKCYVALGLLAAPTAYAHDPVFGLGPHTLFKGGVEVHVGSHQEKAGDERATESEIAIKYGLTADWVAGIGLPYVHSTDESDGGRGPTSLSTKYRFWRNDLPGVQESAAVLAKAGLEVESVPKLAEGRPNTLDLLKNNEIQLVINTPSGQAPRADEIKIRTTAIYTNTPIMTTMGSAKAAAEGIAALKQNGYSVKPLQEYL